MAVHVQYQLEQTRKITCFQRIMPYILTCEKIKSNKQTFGNNTNL